MGPDGNLGEAGPDVIGPAGAGARGTRTRGTGADGWSGCSAGGGAFHCGQEAPRESGGQSGTGVGADPSATG
jgi:hypothetical protein